jgi:transcriptional regulator with XRE-family HTH domain
MSAPIQHPLSILALAKRLGVDRQRLYNVMKAGKLKARATSSGYVIDSDECNRLLAARRGGRRTPSGADAAEPVKKAHGRRRALKAARTEAEQAELDEFATNLRRLLDKKGWSYSDLAREAWGEIDTKTGKAARNRDRVSVYARGLQYPDPKNLQLITKALGVETSELAPRITASAAGRTLPEFSMTAVTGHPDEAHVRVDKLVSWTVATEIAQLLNPHLAPQSEPWSDPDWALPEPIMKLTPGLGFAA